MRTQLGAPAEDVGGVERYYLGGRRLMAFTVNEERRVRALFDQGVAVVLTDALAHRF